MGEKTEESSLGWIGALVAGVVGTVVVGALLKRGEENNTTEENMSSSGSHNPRHDRRKNVKVNMKVTENDRHTANKRKDEKNDVGIGWFFLPFVFLMVLVGVPEVWKVYPTLVIGLAIFLMLVALICGILWYRYLSRQQEIERIANLNVSINKIGGDEAERLANKYQ
jgi:Flp pilus assembly protein TadB